MIKKVFIKHRIGTAVKIDCKFEGSIEEYAMAWLHLTNNAREYPKIFLKHYNNSGNNVTVITTEKYQEKMKQYLKGLEQSTYKDGELKKTFTVDIWNVEIIQTITPLVDWECDYEDDSDDDIQVLPEEEFFH